MMAMSEKGQSEVGPTFEEFYVKDQILITGPVDQIGRVVDEVTSRQILGLDVKLEFAEGREIDLWRPQMEVAGVDRAEVSIWDCLAKHLEDIPPDPSACLDGILGMHLYNVGPETDDRNRGLVEEVARRINRAGADRCVHGGPNWLTGYQYSAAGSPFAIPDTAVQPDEFWEQWALERIGLIQNGMRATRRCGQGVRVGVFDTSPFEVEGRPMPACAGHPPLLTVVHPTVFDDYPVPPPPDLPDPPDLNSHGLSVAGLVYAVAPHSDIFLYRVLDRHARGNLYVLCCALIEFMKSVLSNPDDAPNGGIINLSLGLVLPAGWRRVVGAKSVFALDFVLAMAHCLGLTVVAAAGNESTRRGRVKSPGFPASQPYAIGVKASNYCNDRSCFSNNGDVTAPGGDGYDCGEEVGGDCACPWDKVTDANERRKYGLVGPVLPNGEFQYGFARWLGTSFATPLVSGLAALIHEHHDGPPVAGVSSEISDHASEEGNVIVGGDEIEGCDEIKGGIINLPGYLL